MTTTNADLKVRLRDAKAAEPILIGQRSGFDTYRRGDLVFAIPAAPIGSNSRIATAINAARSAWLGDQCTSCAARLHVRARDGVILAVHARLCPGRAVSVHVRSITTFPRHNPSRHLLARPR